MFMSTGLSPKSFINMIKNVIILRKLQYLRKFRATGIRYIRTDAEAFLTLMKYNIWAIFEAENYSSKLLFHFCHLTGRILTLRGPSSLEVKFILSTLSKFEQQLEKNVKINIISIHSLTYFFLDKTVRLEMYVAAI